MYGFTNIRSVLAIFSREVSTVIGSSICFFLSPFIYRKYIHFTFNPNLFYNLIYYSIFVLAGVVEKRYFVMDTKDSSRLLPCKFCDGGGIGRHGAYALRSVPYLKRRRVW